MAGAKEKLTTTSDITVKAREVDFVTRFGRNWQSLQEILGIMRPVRKAPGTTLTSYTAAVELESGSVAEGEDIPYSKATVTPESYADLELRKWAKAVSIEAVNQYGAAVAVQRTDEAFLNELQGTVLGEFYDFLKTGKLRPAGATDLQMGIALAIGSVVDKFKKLRRDTTNIVVFINTMDAYKYLGAADVSVQTTNGLTYLKNFMGAGTVILSSEIEAGTVIATPADNIVLYYVDPGDGEFSQLGLNYTVEGETNLIGFHANGNYSTAVGESFALMGIKLWAEYLDAIAVVGTSLTGPNGINAISGDAQLYGKKASELGTFNVVADGTNVKIYGDAKSVSSYTEFSSNSAEQNGHYVPLEMPVSFAGAEVEIINAKGKVKKVKFDAVEGKSTDRQLVTRIDDYKDGKTIQTFLIDGQEVLTIDYAGVTQASS